MTDLAITKYLPANASFIIKLMRFVLNFDKYVSTLVLSCSFKLCCLTNFLALDTVIFLSGLAYVVLVPQTWMS